MIFDLMETLQCFNAFEKSSRFCYKIIFFFILFSENVDVLFVKEFL